MNATRHSARGALGEAYKAVQRAQRMIDNEGLEPTKVLGYIGEVEKWVGFAKAHVENEVRSAGEAAVICESCNAEVPVSQWGHHKYHACSRRVPPIVNVRG